MIFSLRFIMNELLQTERTYVADLNCVIEVRICSFFFFCIGQNISSRSFSNNQSENKENFETGLKRAKPRTTVPLSSAGKHVTSDKRGKTCDQWQARENMWPVMWQGLMVSAGKSASTKLRILTVGFLIKPITEVFYQSQKASQKG